ncbi:MAG: LysM peptidoglycan-binding domain-containing protein [Parachlamydiaceae bacterium]
MSRRDTIIIALLVNASLLALLFMLAVNSDDEVVIDQPDMVKSLVENREMPPTAPRTVPIALSATHLNDEVDSFLNDLAKEDRSQPLVIDEEGYVVLTPEPPTPLRPMVAETQPVTTTYDKTQYVEITVKRGDALEKIARSNGTTIDAIKKANHLTSANLSIGQVLRVPVSQTQLQPQIKNSSPIAEASPQQPPIPQPKPVPQQAAATPQSTVQYYIVKKGDNPWKIAKQFNVKFEDLLKMNNLDEARARNMKIGDKIRVK